MKELAEEPTTRTGRRTLLRDLVVFQVKLLVDGMRDLILVPASLVAGIASLVSGRDGQPGLQFYRLLALGKQSERWINLFAALQNAPQNLEHSPAPGDSDIDEIVERFESYVVDEYKRGGVTKQAKDHLDKILKTMQR